MAEKAAAEERERAAAAAAGAKKKKAAEPDDVFGFHPEDEDEPSPRGASGANKSTAPVEAQARRSSVLPRRRHGLYGGR